MPVLATDAAARVFGPGHNSFTTDAAGRPVIVYHARDYRDIKGNPLFDPNRHARAEYVRFDTQGIPQFMPPAPDGPCAAEEDGGQVQRRRLQLSNTRIR